MTEPIASRIAQVFNAEFLGSHNTLMSGGAAEPLYLPGVGCEPSRIRFTHDYPASALHEAAHWCLAGRDRRSQRDYGYWYVPGPRTAPQRCAFFAVEAQVQALEAIFAQTCGVRFVVSADDFAASPEEIDQFRQRIEQLVAQRGACLPNRARRFRDALTCAFSDALALEHERG
jgi:elongation factor P hydroxylase